MTEQKNVRTRDSRLWYNWELATGKMSVCDVYSSEYPEEQTSRQHSLLQDFPTGNARVKGKWEGGGESLDRARIAVKSDPE